MVAQSLCPLAAVAEALPDCQHHSRTGGLAERSRRHCSAAGAGGGDHCKMVWRPCFQLLSLRTQRIQRCMNLRRRLQRRLRSKLPCFEGHMPLFHNGSEGSSNSSALFQARKIEARGGEAVATLAWKAVRNVGPQVGSGSKRLLLIVCCMQQS